MNRSGIVPPMRLAFVMWLVYTIQLYAGIDLGFLGILPRTYSGMIGILTAPLIHGTTAHLMSNTFPLLFLGTTLYLFYGKLATRVFVQCYLITNLMVWIFGRPFYHIGASGIVYGLAAFLVSFGIFDRNFRSILISIVIIVFYGGLVYGIYPQNDQISWESHLFGTIVGVGSAFGMSKVRRKVEN